MLTFIIPLRGKGDYRDTQGLTVQVGSMFHAKDDDNWEVIGQHREIWEPLLIDWDKSQAIKDEEQRGEAVGEWFEKYTPLLETKGYKVLGLATAVYVTGNHILDMMEARCEFDCDRCHDGSIHPFDEEDDD